MAFIDSRTRARPRRLVNVDIPSMMTRASSKLVSKPGSSTLLLNTTFLFSSNYELPQDRGMPITRHFRVRKKVSCFFRDVILALLPFLVFITPRIQPRKLFIKKVDEAKPGLEELFMQETENLILCLQSGEDICLDPTLFNKRVLPIIEVQWQLS